MKNYAASEGGEKGTEQGEEALMRVRQLDQVDGRYDLVAKGETVYLVDKTAETWKEIEGMDSEMLNWTAVPSAGSEASSMIVLYNGLGNDTEEAEMGMIDLQEDILYLWKRKRDPAVEETGAWCQGSRIFLDAHIKESGLWRLYIYNRRK